MARLLNFVDECSIIPAQVDGNQYTSCNVISHALCHSRTYPVTIPKKVRLICVYINYNAYANTCAYWC